MLRLRRSRGDAQHERELKSHERLPFALSVAQRSRRADARVLSPFQKGFRYSAFYIPQSAIALAFRLIGLGNDAVQGDRQYFLLGMIGEHLDLSLDAARFAFSLGPEG
jgi:hypothetical protein